jgi:hypothetical protein
MKARLIPVFFVVRLIGPAILVLIRVIVVMYVPMTHMAAVMNVTSRIVLMDVHDGSRVCPGRHRQCHAYGGREGKHDRQHRPEGGAVPACSTPARQHALDPQSTGLTIAGRRYQIQDRVTPGWNVL